MCAYSLCNERRRIDMLMAIYAISDLHLSLSGNKPMDIFGERWEGYEEKMKQEWNQIVADEDYVIVCGDISWATYLEQAETDFSYINALKGKKIISKGNHDYWWETLTKQNKFLADKGFGTISFLHNNYYLHEGTAICGSKGAAPLTSGSSAEEEKIYNREIQRFRLSLELAKNENEIIAALHYPPDSSFIAIMKEYNVKHCVYGHLHGAMQKNARSGLYEGICFHLVSCEYLGFIPKKIAD